jgi:hypothetical protein
VTTRHEAGWSTNSTRTSFDDAERRAPPRSLPLRELGVPAPPTGGGASVAIEVEVDDDNDDDDDDELWSRTASTAGEPQPPPRWHSAR